MKRYSAKITQMIAVFSTIGLLTGCGAAGAASTAEAAGATGTAEAAETTGTASTGDYDASLVAGSEIHDLGTETIELSEDDVAELKEAQKKYLHYLEETLADIIISDPSVKDATVVLAVEHKDSVAASLAGARVSILLELEEELTEEGIVNIAEAAARSADVSTEQVTIVDTDGRILYLESEPFPESDI